MPVYNVSNTTKQNCPAGADKTVLQIQAPSTRHLTVSAFTIGGFSIDPAHQTGAVRVIISDAAGTSSGAVTPVPVDQRETPALFTARETFSAEPGTNVKLVGGNFALSPVSTLLAWQLSPDEVFVVPVNKFLSIVCNFPGASQDVMASLVVKE